MPTVRFNPAKWANRSSAAGGEYDAGVRNPRKDWAGATAAAEGNFEAGINEAIATKRFSKGVNAAGSQKWSKGATEKGRARYTQGVTTSQDEYRAGFEKYARVIEGVTLQPRGPKGTNYGRVQAVGDALRAAKNQ